MSSRREELELELEWVIAFDAFIAAKEIRDIDPEGYAAAKAEMSKLRVQRRQMAEANKINNSIKAISVESNMEG